MDNSKKIDLTCLGIIVLDAICKTIDEFPREGASVYFDSMELLPGGCAYNTGVDAKRLGLSVSVQGKIGKDHFGDILLEHLKKEQIMTENIARGNESTGFSVVLVPGSGQRRILHTPGVNNTYNFAEINLDTIIDSKVLHMAGSSLLPALDGTPTIEILKLCRSHQVLTSMDPVYKKGIAKVIVPCLEHLDLFLPNNDESEHITGYIDPEDQLKFYLDNGVGIAGIKLGEKGLLISDGKQKFQLGIYNVKVADTCGAGDAFIAGFIYGMLNGLSLYETSRFATAAAAHCVQGTGATTGMTDAGHIAEFMRHHQLSEVNPSSSQ